MEHEVLLDSGMLIGALLKGDSRHIEARVLVQQARAGEINAATTVGILCEVYAALTWEGATPRHAPAVAADAVMAIIQAPSKIRVLPETESVLSMMLEIAKKNRLHARRIHDARHAYRRQAPLSKSAVKPAHSKALRACSRWDLKYGLI